MNSLNDLQAEVLSEMLSKGYDPGNIILDCLKPQRFGPNKSQWYVAHKHEAKLNGALILIVHYGDWRTGEKFRFQNGATSLSPDERRQLQAQIERAEEAADQARQEIQNDAAVEYQEKWAQLSALGTSPYLERKMIPEAFGGRFQDDTLYLPCRNANGEIRTLQKIQPDGGKFFLPGGEARGSFHVIGSIEESETIYLAEGFATGASIHLATTGTVVIAFNADNLLYVAQVLFEKYPTKSFIICGDDDQWTKKSDGITPMNPGREKAKKAAKQVNGQAVFPRFQDPSSKPTDFNDLHCLEGLEMVAEQLKTENKQTSVSREKAPSQATLLLNLCDGIELFHTSDENGYATVPVNKHKETWALGSQGFRRWLLHKYFSTYGTAPTSQAIIDALGTLSANAQFKAEERPIFLRAGMFNGNVYVDLSNDEWEVVEISASGWSVIKDSPVRFLRKKGMLPLPRPICVTGDTSVAQLCHFLNVDSEEDFRLIVAFILSSFNPDGPFLVLVLYGEQGTAKSTTVKVIRSFVDPNSAPLRKEPKNSDDLMVSARGNWIIAIDNMSYL
ncbi:toprim domain-containing protein [Bdellovibrionota bacterium FG-2]